MRSRFLAASGMKKRMAALLSAAMIVTGLGAPVYAAAEDEDATFEQSLETEEEIAAVGEEEFVAPESDLDEDEPLEAEGEDAVLISTSEAEATASDNGFGDGGSVSAGNVSRNGVSDNKPSAADLKTFVFDSQGGKPVDPKDAKICSATFSAGNVKIKYKMPGAKYYAIAKVANTETGAGVTVIKPFDVSMDAKDKYKKKSYTDKSVTNGSGLYVVAGYDEGGNCVGKYVAIPTSYMMAASSASNGDVKVTFAAVGTGSSYRIDISPTNKFNGSQETVTVSEDSLIEGSVAGRDSMTYIDKGRALEKNLIGTGFKKKRVFYRVQAVAKPQFTETKEEMVSKYSNKLGCYGERYAALVVRDMVGTELHEDGCYAGAIMYFSNPSDNSAKLDTNYITASNTSYDVYRTINGKSYTKIATVKGSALLTNRTVGGEKWYGINLTNLTPGMKYSYSVIATRNSKSTEMSNVYNHYFDFYPVFGLTTEAHNATTVRLKWKTEQCATKYAIYRTNDCFNTVSEASTAIMEDYEQIIAWDQREVLTNADLRHLPHKLKKAKTVNNTLMSGSELTADVGKLKSAMYYGFMVVPVNDKAYGYSSAGMICDYGSISSPKTLKYTTKGLTSFKLTWGKVSKATGYLVERITVKDQATADKMDGDEDWKEMYETGTSENAISEYLYQTYPSSTKSIVVTEGDGKTMETAKPGEAYAYRVLSIYVNNRTGKEEVSLPIKDVYQVGVIGPKRVKELKSAIVTRKKGDNYYWDSNNNKHQDLSGNKIGARGVKVTFTVQDKNNTDHYEIARSTDDGYTFTKIGEMHPGSVNEGNTYKSGAKTITFYDGNLSRGIPYVYRVRPVSGSGIPGAWVNVEFSVASAWSMYAMKNSNYNNINCVNKKTAFSVNSGSSYRIYVMFTPDNVTEDEYDYSCPDWVEVTGRGDEEINGYTVHYIDIKITDGVSDKDGKLKLKYNRPYDEVEKGTVKQIKDISMHLRVD